MESAVRVPGTAESAGHPSQPAEAPARAGARVQRAPVRETVRRVVMEKVRGQPKAHGPAVGPRRRTDVRLVPAALLVWCAAIAGAWLTPSALLGLSCGLVVLAGVLVGKASRSAVRRSVLTTASIAVLLALSTAAHSAVASSQRNDGPLADAVRDGEAVVAILEVTGAPRALSPAGRAGVTERWSVPATAVEVTAGGQMLRTHADVVVMGGGDWGAMVAGQRIRTTGKLKRADPGQTEAAVLAASSAPVLQSGGGVGFQEGADHLRSRYVSAAAFLARDPAGLLPGMVTGDTSALDEGLNANMQTVGMTHLTAVSGANCSLVLGALLLMARSLRLPRVPAAVLALAGLGLFVLLVGPDASVLRAAVMGSIALASLAGGRTGRGLSFLCLAVIGLLLFDPGLGTSFGFLLSVLATLGIIVLGQRLVDLAPAWVPRWVAAAFAVPLSAQLLCGPVIVLLQPQFSTYSLLANVVAAPFVAPVTLLGTAAVPLTVLAPWAATGLIAVAGTFCGGVAWTARFMAGLPGAALPWPEGAFGLATMAALSVLSLAMVLLAFHPRVAADLVLGLHGHFEQILERAEGLSRPWPCPRSRGKVPGVEPRSRHGRFRPRTKTSRRNPAWPLRPTPETGRRRPARPPGAT